ncbi:Transcription termination factor 1 [Merluccius polli]|uniref:Transcription termination factor 1 n=1 Tax=Merluccius polli TaxID=89951 RepID=A0AA47NSH5_MERPO|nr:Transcription termination factor 1 [Merluccius polli]
MIALRRGAPLLGRSVAAISSGDRGAAVLRRLRIELRWGRFLKWENLKIKENVANFLALTGIETANQLFYPERYRGQVDIIKRLRVQHSFMHRIAEDIPRPCYKVHTRAKKTFDDLNYLGRFSEDENLQLQKLQRIHGNDWKTISSGMDRSMYSVQKRFNMMTTTVGPWSQEEVDILLGVMKLHLERLAGENQPGSGNDGAADAGSGPEQLWLTKRQLYNKLPWKSISEKVTSRSWLQCREKWFTILKTKLSTHKKEVRGGGSQSVLSKINLINTLYAMDLEDAAEIDWEQVADCLGNVTPHHAQKIFNCLKMTRVPHSSVLSFCELIDFLHDKVIPMLRNKLNQMADSCPLQQEEEVQNKYLLSNIFSDEEYMELDNTA